MQEISLNILDIAQNSVRADASLIEISVIENTGDSTLEVVIRDNGCGMTAEQVENVIDPFFTTRTTRRVGLGVPFFKMACEMTGGSFDIKSKVGVGTTVTAVFHTDSIDCMPLGNIEDTIHSLVTLNGHIDFLYVRKIDENDFTLDTKELREILGDIPFNEPQVSMFIRNYIIENSNELAKNNSKG